MAQFRRLARFAVVAAFVLPQRVVEHGPTLCLFRRVTGLDCPNCGLARSWTATAHGQLGRGLRMHPLGPLAFVAAVLFVVMPHAWLNRLQPWILSAAPIVGPLWLGTWLLRLVGRGLSHRRSDHASPG